MALVVRGTSNSSFKIVPSTSGYKAVIMDDANSVDIKFYSEKVFILIKACNDDCKDTNDFYVGGIYSSICKIFY